MQLTRRALVSVASVTGAALAASPFADLGQARAQTSGLPKLPSFGFGDVIARARDLATAPFDPAPPLPAALAQMTAQDWSSIRFRPESAFFAESGGPFRMQLFHLGGPYAQAVTINIVRDGIATPIPYTANLFDYGRAHPVGPLPINLGFAGFRFHYPLNDAGVFDEVLAFLGATYFRMLGRGQRYGLSARGIAVDAGQPDEEFPFFREFWIEAPSADADRVRFYALLDGPSLTGAYQFGLLPGEDAKLRISASLFARKSGRKFGLAPLTSMFCSGENDRRIHDDYRPERHDSDGLALHTGAGEWIWRPLRNPPSPAFASFLDRDVGGFGLLQRDRNFDHYQDIDRAFELHPSYWVEPVGGWGAGKIELIELPTSDDSSDNIVASWIPDEPLAPGAIKEIAYTITAFGDGRDPSPNGRVVDTFETTPQADGATSRPSADSRRFMVDFAGGDLGYRLSAPSTVTVVPTAVGGQILRSFLTPNQRAGGFRAALDVALDKGQNCELRLFLRADGRALTETWTLPWTAP
jgi:periplasmic glucans biosynthesis protein